jgi:8-oxo-dGTP diphosphatase
MSFAVVVDLVLFTIRDDRLCALVVRRGSPPYRGRWALPGGFVAEDEGLLDAARRELAEETGLDDLRVHLEQLATYGDPGRDPRGRIVSVVHLAFGPELPEPQAGDDAAAAKWRPVDELLSSRLAFDHRRILTDGLERARAKLEYTPLATAFVEDHFTVAELRHVYEVVWNTRLDPRNFHRKVTGSPGMLEPTGGRTTRNGGRPAQLYRRGKAVLLNPPITRQ